MENTYNITFNFHDLFDAIFSFIVDLTVFTGEVIAILMGVSIGLCVILLLICKLLDDHSDKSNT